MMTGGFLARYLSPAMQFLQEEHVQRQEQQKNQENDRYYTTSSSNNSCSSCRPPPPPVTLLETQSVSLSSISTSSSSSLPATRSVPLSSTTKMVTPLSSSPSSAPSPLVMVCSSSGGGGTMTRSFCSNNRRANNNPGTINTSRGDGSGGCGYKSAYSTSTSSSSYSTATRFPSFFVIPSILLLIVSNQGIVRHVQGQQTWSDPQHHAAAGFGQQYASFEELQRLTENPFENNTAVNVTVPLGDNAFLRCKVRNLGERSISWVRRRDWHILTSGKTTYTNDERFHVLHADGSDEWTLQIKFVQKRDNGTYECQVSTGTGIVSYLVHLKVTVPEVFILGNGEYHVEQGSTISLVCVIEKSPKPPEYIFWYHNQRMINYGSSREVKVINEPGSKTHSRLTIRDAQISDSGNYTCETAHAEPASTLVYVSQGDQIAAIQKRKAAAAASSTSVTSFSTKSPHHHVAPIKLNLAISIINVTLLVPFLLSQSSSCLMSFITNFISSLLIFSSSLSRRYHHHKQNQDVIHFQQQKNQNILQDHHHQQQQGTQQYYHLESSH